MNVTITKILGYATKSTIWCLRCAVDLFTSQQRAKMTPLHIDDVKDKNVCCGFCERQL